MKAVSNIGKITKAMKMVASSKRRMDLLRLEGGKNFGVGVVPKIFANDPVVKQKFKDAPKDKVLLIPFTSDKGLCGSINSNLLRHLREKVNKDRNKYKIICMGDKGSAALQRPYPDLF